MVGVSNGGNSVLKFATLHPELCCGLVCATGMLNGLVELPAALHSLQGVPIDMYVGTKDECGFYPPMVDLDNHLRAVDHKPHLPLNVFEGATHICSPLIDGSVLHGKIWLMLRLAGLMGAGVDLEVLKTGASDWRTVQKHLISFCEALGMQWRLDERGMLSVWKLDEVTPPPTMISLRDLEPESGVPEFDTGDAVEIWSNSNADWLPAQIQEKSKDSYAVVYSDQRGQVRKIVPFHCAQEFLRKATREHLSYNVGDAVRVWSESDKKWYNDGRVSLVSDTDGIRVEYANNERKKDIGPTFVPALLQKLPHAFSAGDAVKVYSSSNNTWFEDGLISSVSDDFSLVVDYADGTRRKRIPAQMAGEVLEKQTTSGSI